jgi:hypothetical protein
VRIPMVQHNAALIADPKHDGWTAFSSASLGRRAVATVFMAQEKHPHWQQGPSTGVYKVVYDARVWVNRHALLPCTWAREKDVCAESRSHAHITLYKSTVLVCVQTSRVTRPSGCCASGFRCALHCTHTWCKPSSHPPPSPAEKASAEAATRGE